MGKKQTDVLVIGAGPAGIFTALELVKHNTSLSVLIVEEGRKITKRYCPERTTGICIKCPVCAITAGWSGAGAFSDGKLSLSPDVGGHIEDYLGREEAKKMISYADDIYVQYGAPDEIWGLEDENIEEIAYEASKHHIKLVQCPVRHLGTERAYAVLKNMYDALAENPQFEFWELTTAKEIIVEDGVAKGAKVLRNDEEILISAKYVVAAPGRSGANWLSQEAKRLQIKQENNAVDIGVRVEVPNSVMDHLTKVLYEAKLVYFSDTYENQVRTFCMNPGGVVAGEIYDRELAVVNGHSYGDDELKTNNTNFAILVSTHFTEPFNEPITYGRYIARLANMLTGGGVMVQRLGDLERGRRTTEKRLSRSITRPTMLGAVPGDLSYVLPARYLTAIVEAIKAYDKIAPGMYSKDTLLYGVEVKFYSSKIDVDKDFATAIEGLYTIGDGAGITRGLIQASVTGIVVANDILKKEQGSATKE